MQVYVSQTAAEYGTSTILNFFENWQLHDALYCFQRLMDAACADKLLLNTIPANHLYFVSELKKLGEAASLALMEELGKRCIDEYLQIADGKEFHAKARREKQKAQRMLLTDDREQRINRGNPAGFEQRDNWMSTILEGDEWQCFPRHLSVAQFNDPWLALEAFVDSFSATVREDHLDVLLEQALGEGNIDLFIPSSDIVRLQRSWCQLLEGCHLLAVRKFL